MPEPSALRINPAVSIPLSELRYQASRSGGPGGQHVNTSATRIELWWDAAGSPSLSPHSRARVLARLATRLDAAGRLRLVSGGSRSQWQNREEVTERFRQVLAKALEIPKPRKKTRPPRSAAEKRLRSKKRRGQLKRQRRGNGTHDD